MTDPHIITSNNLIDLTIEPSSPDMMLMQPIFPPNESMIVAHTGRLSIENNPFDHLEKLAKQFDDPFEIVQTQADRNRAANSTSRNVLTESLIFIENSPQKTNRTSDKDLSGEADNSVFNDNLPTVPELRKGESCNIRSGTIGSISMEPLSESQCKAFETDTSIKCEIESSQSGVFDINKGFIDPVRSNRIHSDPAAIHHKIKLSEAANRGRSSSVGMLQQKPNQLLKLSLKNSSFGSPKERTAAKLMAISPTIDKLSDTSIFSDDDLMATSMHWIDSDGDINQEVDHVNDELIVTSAPNKVSPSPEKPVIQSSNRLTLIENYQKCKQKMSESKIEMEKSPSALEELVESAEISTIKPQGNSQVSDLLERVKQVIGLSESGDIKAEATVLLDSLHDLLGQKHLHAAPAPIVRQATFNIENITNQQQQDEAILSSVTPAAERVISPDAGVSNIVQQLEKLLGARKVNVLESVRHESGTYIVVMNTPSAMDSSDAQLNESVSNYLKTRNQRSASLSLPQKPSDVTRAMQAKTDQRQKANTTETPMRSTSSTRRSSFSHSNDQDTPTTQLGRRSIYAAPSKKVIPVRKSLQPATQFSIPPKQSTVRHTTTKLKLRAQEMAKTCSAKGPMRANIPINNFAPHIEKPSLSSPTETGSIMSTSTPRNGHHVVPPSACSTPMQRKPSLGASPPITPIRRISQLGQQNNGRVRFGNLPATPNFKSTSSMLGTLGRRRSLSEFKSGSNSIPTAVESNKPSVSKKTPPRSFGAIKTKKKENEIPNEN